jgi:hypothetical protein
VEKEEEEEGRKVLPITNVLFYTTGKRPTNPAKQARIREMNPTNDWRREESLVLRSPTPMTSHCRRTREKRKWPVLPAGQKKNMANKRRLSNSLLSSLLW